MGNWDNEIDDVAQRLSEGAPDAGFKARVVARVDAIGQRRPLWRSAWSWAPVALAATSVLVVVIVRAPWTTEPVRLKPDTRPTTPTVRLKPDPTYVPTDATTHGRTNTAESYVGSGFSRTGNAVSGSSQRVGMATPIDVIARANDLDSLAPAPIEIAPLIVEATKTTESIQVPPLAVAPLEVVAIGEQ